VLLVEDYEPLREVVRSMLQREGLDVVGEASDGLDAVQKAEQLSPDLILVDIGLPTLNGFEVAEWLGRVIPQAKVVFVSEECSRFVVEEAIRLGVAGYVNKLHIHDELMKAIETVLAGKVFIGSGLDTQFRIRKFDERAPRRHDVLIYSDESVFLESFTRFVAEALRAERPAIAIAAKSQLDCMFQKLAEQGLNVAGQIDEGKFFPLDLRDTLSTFMVDDLPDMARFTKATTQLMRAVHASNDAPKRIVACGVCAPILWIQGKMNAAVWVERLWDDLANTYGVDILCAYPAASFHAGQDERAFRTICAEHSAVYSL
jgi:DNA-binding NarL/FixJ family response regulator